MNRVARPIVTILIVVCAATFAVSLCVAETGVPETSRPVRPPERDTRPPRTRTTLPTPRPIEGGEYYYELAEVHKRYGSYDQAIEMLQKAIEKEKDVAKKARYYESLSEVYRMKGEPEEAAEQIKKVLAEAQTVEEKCRHNTTLGRILEQTGDVEGAKKAYQFVVANATRDTEKSSAQLNLYRLYQKSGELESVVTGLEKKMEDDPTDEEALNTLAQIFTSVTREPSRSLPIYERLAKLKPKDLATLNRLVYLYQSNKEYEKAAEIYQRIIEASPSPNKSYYHQHISRMYMLAGKTDEAVKWAEKSLSEGQARPYTYVSIAQIYLQNGLVDKALQLYDGAMAACQRPMEKHQIALRFGDIFARNNKEDKAEELYKYVMKEAIVASFKSQARSKLIALYRKQGKTREIEALMAEEEAAPGPRE